MIIAHRSGYWGPENSWKSFKRAVDLDMEGFELDVWVTKDGVPIVHHGGPDSQMGYGWMERAFDLNMQ